jgi:signal transduction histidine kinase
MRSRKKAALGAIVFTALVLAAFNVGWWWYYSSIKAYLEQQLSQRLLGTAATAALHISAEDVEGLLIDNLDVYVEKLIYLDSIAVIDSLSEASIIDLDFNYLVTTREGVSHEGYLLSHLNFDSLNQAVTGQPAASALYDVDGTYLKSAYAPLNGVDGEVEAILVAEAGAGYFDLLSNLRNNLLALAGGSAAVVVFLLIIYIIYNRRMAVAEEKLFQASSQAALGRMVAVVSHEIKNPMMIIRAAGERLEKKHDDPEAGFIVEEVARLNNIVSGYLSFSKGESSLNLDKVDLNDMCGKIITEFKSQFNEQAVDLHYDADNELPAIIADPVGIRQVIINLLLNALHAVTSEEQNKPEAIVDMTLLKSGDKVIVRVSDNGPGIKPSQREKLFEPFYTTKTQGSGLGLYLCRRIAEQHNGKINIADIKKGMTTFEVTLPTGADQ